MNLISEEKFRQKLGDASRTSLWEIAKANPALPKPVMVGRKKTFVEAEADAFISTLVAERDGKRAEV